MREQGTILRELGGDDKGLSKVMQISEGGALQAE